MLSLTVLAQFVISTLVIGALSRAMRFGVGQRTSRPEPSFSNSQITRAEMSIWPGSTPCLAEVGVGVVSCAPPPKDAMASGQKFAALSREANGRGADHVADRVHRPGHMVQRGCGPGRPDDAMTAPP